MTDVLRKLAETVNARKHAASGSSAPSYTRQLLDAGVERCARKFGEEALELVIAALAGGSEADIEGRLVRLPLTEFEKSAMVSEAADVLYHMMVLLESRDVAWSDVTERLAARMATSGIAEKAARGSSGVS